MAWISFIFLTYFSFAADLPRFLTKHSSETLRFINMDGRYAYVQKKPGVLGLVSSFRSVDFLSEPSSNNFMVKSSRFKTRLVIESIPLAHYEINLVKNHKIFVVDYGNTAVREIGQGRNAKLHVRDEWISYFNTKDKIIHIQNLLTQKKFEIKLNSKPNPFFIPEVEMLSSTSVVYTDINESGYAALIGYDLNALKSSVIYKSSQSATRLELCQSEKYLALGEFPYEGVSRNSKIQMVNINEITNLSGFNTVYSSIEQDVGNMACLPKSIYFVKSMGHDKEINFKTTEVVKYDVTSQTVEAKTDLKFVTQIIEMDGRILVPFRGELYVLEGISNIGEDILKAVPTKEELQIDI